MVRAVSLKSSWIIRATLAIAGGFASSLAMPREGIWPLAFLSVAALVLSVKGLSLRAASTLGLIGGLSFYLSQIEWLSLYLGPVPWLALSVLEALIFAIGMAAISAVWGMIESRFGSGAIAKIVAALSLASIWTAREWVSISLPYGGFPWSRLVQTQSESPLASWVSLTGFSGLTFIVALIGTLSAMLLIEASKINFSQNSDRIEVLKFRSIAIGLIVLLFALPTLAIRPSIEPEAGTLTVAAVQGNANAGLFANPVRGSILKNHVAATELIAKKPLADQVEVVIWPENASDLSPFSDINADLQIRELTDKLGAPLIFGAITVRGESIFNSSIFWQPDKGPTDWYDKKRPVPFAEYVPDRDFWFQLAPDLIGLISRGYTFGERDGIFNLGQKRLGALICFEIAIDDIGRELVNEGAQVIVSQSNNADFGRSDETFQQAALAKLRAIETGRTVVNVSTVGVTAIYLPNGQVAAQLPTFEPGALVNTVPLRNSKTVATLFAAPLELANNFIALALVAAALVWQRNQRLRARLKS
ncbi:MAG: hypothetical protein RL174_459 [Actinomycetota bacterium]